MPEKKHPIIYWFTTNAVAANILMVTILVLGYFSATSIRTESFPSFESQQVRITIPFRGSTPEDVEKGVIIRIEEALQEVEGIERLTSKARENAAVVLVESETDYPIGTLLDDVKLTVDGLPNLPEEAENPIIQEVKRQRTALRLAIHGDADEYTLKEVTRRLRDALLDQPNIKQVAYTGWRDYEISVEITEATLQRYGLTFEEIANAIRSHSVDFSAGNVRSESGDIRLRARNQAYTVREFATIPIRTFPDGTQLLLGDIATIRDGFEDQKKIHLYNGEPSLGLELKSPEDGSILAITQEAADVLDIFKPTLPKGVQVTEWYDGTKNIRDRLDLFFRNGMSGILMVLFLLAFFLNLRLAFWVALGIPISIAGALWLMPSFDMSINVLSTFGFIVVLGILVDDAVVMGESIYSVKKRDGGTVAPTIKGVARVVHPATFGVLTTIAAFYPLTNVEGRMGDVFGQIATVVILALIFSLVESKLILPAHLAHMDVHRPSRTILGRWWKLVQGGVQRGLAYFVERVVEPVLRTMIRYSFASLLGFISVFVLVVGLVPSGVVSVRFFPSIERDSMTATLQMSERVSPEYTHETARKIGEAAWAANAQLKKKHGLDYDVIESIIVQSEANTSASIRLGLAPNEKRDLNNQQIARAWRNAFEPVDGIRALSFESAAGPRGGTEIELQSENLDALQAAAEQTKLTLAEYEGMNDISDDFKSGRPEIEIRLLPEATAYGLTLASVTRQVRYAYFGLEAQRIQRGRDEVFVKVRYPESSRKTLYSLREMMLVTPSGGRVPFDQVATVRYTESLSEITRLNGRRVVTVRATPDKRITSSEEVLKDMEKTFFPTLKNRFPEVSIHLGGEAEERAKSMGSLKRGFGISLLLILVLLALSLKSYFQPLVILSVIPFGIIGAILGHYFMGFDLSILSMFGILALNGVVVNDSLVLVSGIKSFLEEGLSLEDAIVAAGRDRFRPILLTSLTTFAGLTPILAEQSMQAQFLKPMAISLGFGILFATVITLFAVPIMFHIGQQIRQGLHHLLK